MESATKREEEIMENNLKEYHCNVCGEVWKSNDFFPICICKSCHGTHVTYYDVGGLKLTHTCTTKNVDGLIDFTVLASNGKEYTFKLTSERDVNRALFLLKKTWYGKAMSYLMKVSLKEEVDK
jgi:ribosomal protein L37AE/L43A